MSTSEPLPRDRSLTLQPAARSARLRLRLLPATPGFSGAQDTIVEVAKSTAHVIERARAAAAERMEIEFGLSYSATGGVIMAGVAGAATLDAKGHFEF
jgi:hypothetical protein